MAREAPPNAAVSSALQGLVTQHLRPALDGLKSGTLTLRGVSLMNRLSLNSSDGCSSVRVTVTNLLTQAVRERQGAPGFTKAIAASGVVEVATQLYSALCSPEGLQAAIGGTEEEQAAAAAPATAAASRGSSSGDEGSLASPAACWAVAVDELEDLMLILLAATTWDGDARYSSGRTVIEQCTKNGLLQAVVALPQFVYPVGRRGASQLVTACGLLAEGAPVLTNAESGSLVVCVVRVWQV